LKVPLLTRHKTLTILGSGSLTASSNGYCAGIGGGDGVDCGNITITGGTINATGGYKAAGIGSGIKSSCGNITITGGTVNATGGDYAAGIGSGGGTDSSGYGTYYASCGNITITNTVTSVNATKGSNATNSIGAGRVGKCGTVTIGGTVGAISTSPYTYNGTGAASASVNLVNPVFSGVTISNTPAATETDGSEWVDFVGTYSPEVIYESGDKHNLYLGSGNNIYYPTREGYTVNACRAYFQLKNGLTAGEPTSSEAPVRAFVLDFGDGEETAIRSLTPDTSPAGKGSDGWYTLDGRRLSAKPTASGIYINNGRKVVIK